MNASLLDFPANDASSVVDYLCKTALLVADLSSDQYSTDRLRACVRWLLDNRKDELLSAAIDAVKCPNAARLIRRVAEMESASVGRDSTASQDYSLFTVAVLMRLTHDVPGGVIEHALKSMPWPDTLSSLLWPRHGRAHRQLIKRFHSFEDIAGLPLSKLRNHTLRLAGMHSKGEPLVSPFPAIDGPLRRSNIFLRYLVGVQDGEAGEELMNFEPLAEAVSSYLHRCLKQPCVVSCGYLNEFHESLFTGLWRYQIDRLEWLSQTIVGQSVAGSEVSALLVGLSGHRHPYGEVAFFGEGRLAGKTAYRFRTRPREDSTRCLSRVGETIVRAGVAHVDRIEPDVAASPRAHLLWISVPL